VIFVDTNVFISFQTLPFATKDGIEKQKSTALLSNRKIDESDSHIIHRLS
jgi:hypothetical protein